MILSQAAIREIEDIIANDVITMRRPKNRSDIDSMIRQQADSVISSIKNQLDYDRIHELVDSDLDKVNRYFSQNNVKKKSIWSNLFRLR